MTRSLPAYARALADARRRGLTLKDPTVSVALHGLRRPGIGYGVSIPDDRDPAALDWGWCRDLEVIVFRRGELKDRVQSAIKAIRKARPKRLLLIDCTPRVISIIDPNVSIIDPVVMMEVADV